MKATQKHITHALATIKRLEGWTAASHRKIKPEDEGAICITPHGLHSRNTAVRWYEAELEGIPAEGVTVELEPLTETLKLYKAAEPVDWQCIPGQWTITTEKGINLAAPPAPWIRPEPIGALWSETVDAQELAAVAEGASTDDMRPVLTTVNIGSNGAVATDSYKLFAAHSAKLEPCKEEGINLPAAELRQLGKLKTGSVRITRPEQFYKMRPSNPYPVFMQAVISAPGKKFEQYAELTIKREPIDGQYPKWTELIPKVCDTTAKLESHAAALFAAMAKMQKGHEPMRIRQDDDRIRADSEQAGASAQEVGKVTDGESDPRPVGVNPEFFSAAAKFAELEDRPAVLKMRGPLKPLTLETPGGKRSAVVMPVRINENETA